jgi:hypothetical protein
MQKTILELITLANKLDSLGLKKEADKLDYIIKSAIEEEDIKKLLEEWREADVVERSRELDKEEEEITRFLHEQALDVLSNKDI